MTGPDVLVSGGERELRRLPPWFRRSVAGLVVGGLLVAGLARLSADQQRQERLERVADAVDVRSSVSGVGIGVGGTVVLGVQVTGTGADVRVEAPALVPPDVAGVSAVGAPLVVGIGRGNLIRLRLRPDCGRVLTLPRVDLDLPMTPASGKRHVVRVAFYRGPDMLRRACGFLPLDEALVGAMTAARLLGDRLLLDVGLRNDGRRAVTVSGVGSPGLLALAPTAPVTVPPRGAAVLPVELRMDDCLLTGPLRVVVRDEDGQLGELVLSYDGAAGAALGVLHARHCA